jgi:predicted hydrocarbon binding protein
LEVRASPFVAGWHEAGGGAAETPVCAPVAGLLAALTSEVLQGDVTAEELHCAACTLDAAAGGDNACRFEARLNP